MTEEANAMIVLDEHLGWRPWCSGRMNPTPRRSRRWQHSTQTCVDVIVARYLEALGTGDASNAADRVLDAGEVHGVETTWAVPPRERCSPHPIASRRRLPYGKARVSDSEMERLERAFLTHACAYSQTKGISYETWRESGVPARVLEAAGIKP